MKHPDVQTIVRYVAKTASEREYLDVDLHLAACSACFQQVQGMLLLRNDFENIWESCSLAELHRLETALSLLSAANATKAQTPLQARIANWIQEHGKAASLKLQVLLDHTRRIATAAAALPGDYAFELQLAQGVGASEASSRLARHLLRGSKLLSEGRSSDAAEQLLEAMRIDARAPQASVSYITRAGRQFVEVIADGRRASVSLKWWNQPDLPEPAFAILVPEEPGPAPKIAEFVPLDDHGVWLLEFVEVEDGVYSMEIVFD